MSRFLSGYFELADDGTTGPSEVAAQLLRAPTARVTIQGVENAFYGYGHGVSDQGPDQTLYHSGGNPGVVAYLIVARMAVWSDACRIGQRWAVYTARRPGTRCT